MFKKVFKMGVYVFLLLAGLLVVSIPFVMNNFGKNPSAEEEAAYASLPYYRDGQFQSPQKLHYDFNNVRGGKPGFFRFLRQSEYAPGYVLPKEMLNRTSFPETPDQYALYWLGHSAGILDVDGKRLIFDPVLGNAAPIPFAVPRFDQAPIERSELPAVDYIVITHNHYDHLEKKTVQSMKTGHFIVPLGVGAALRGWGIDPERITELGWGDSYVKDGLTVTAVEGVHYSNRSPFNRNKTLWNSYIVKSEHKNIFWGGDTGYGKHFKRIGSELGPFDLAVLEIDGWNTGWPNTHMLPHEVIQATKDLNADVLLPIHWAVFDLALHPLHESIDMVLDEADGKGITVLTPKMGQKLTDGSKTQHWWKERDRLPE